MKRLDDDTINNNNNNSREKMSTINADRGRKY